MPKRIGELIPHVLRRVSHAHATLTQLQERWSRLVGRELARHSRPTSLRRGTLYVHADQPAASFLISFAKARILAGLSEMEGREIREMVVRIGDV